MHKSGHKPHACSDHGCSSKTSVKVTKEVPLDATMSLFKVSGMDCADEIAAIQSSLAIDGVYSVEANLMASTVQVAHADTISKQQIAGKINKSGVRVVEDGKKSSAVPLSRIVLVSLSGILVTLGFVLQYGFSSLLEYSNAAFVGAILLGGVLIYPKAFRALKKLSLEMNVLMSVAVLGALYLREYSEAATVVFLFALSELLEAFSVVRARRAIQEVLNLTPKTAFKKNASGELESVEVSDLKAGDVVVVRAGDLLPIDGIVITGDSKVNQAPLTGESKPVDKAVGDSVFAGTINLSGLLEVRANHTIQESKVSQIIRMVEDAQKSKAPSQSFVDQFARIYTPVVFIFAILIMVVPPVLFAGAWDVWIYKALVLLVIACPCALVISTPVSIVSGLTAMARNGVLVKGGLYLEALGKLQAVAVDKTGTITEGVPRVVSVKHWADSVSEFEALQIAASIETVSTHPLAKAIVTQAQGMGIELKTIENVQTVVARGIFATIEGHDYFLGNHKFAHELGVCSPEVESYLQSLEEQALSVVIVGHKPHAGCEGEVLAILGVGDRIRENAKDSIESLHRVGCRAVVMLSGDNAKTVRAISDRVGIDEAYGELLPDGKVEKIGELVERYKHVGMVGDGINDAPALARSSVGIAMGAIGTDAAIETADVALMNDDLSQLAKAIALGKRVLGIIRFNIAFALVLKAVFLLLALSGYSSMWMAIAADTGATLLVILNSLRLLGQDSFFSSN